MTPNLLLASLPLEPSRIPALLKLLEREQSKRKAQNRLRQYAPYTKQRDFHTAGATHHERLFMAGNQLGKTWAGGFETAMHLTGRYPDWWQGATFDKAPIIWASGVTGESTRDNPQRVLIGNPPREEEWGTGTIPKDCLIDFDRAMGVPNLLDNYVVRWGGGGDVQAGEAIVYFKAYEKGREKWQGPTIDAVWFDEEPPLDIYTEGLTRTNRGQRSQFAYITFTPLLGMSDVVSMFLLGEGAN
jgi:phage terminase large subunit-like protein